MKHSPFVRVATLVFAASVLAVLVLRASSACAPTQSVPPEQPAQAPANEGTGSTPNDPNAPPTEQTANAAPDPSTGHGPSSAPSPSAPLDPAFLPATKSGAVLPIPQQQASPSAKDGK